MTFSVPSACAAVKDAVKAAVVLIGQNFFFLVARDETARATQGPFLVIAPHPDDETLGCGAFVARVRHLGQEVRVVIVVDGEEATATTPAMIDKRRKEGIDACAVLGIGADNVVFLQQPNGAAGAHVDAIEAGLRAEIEQHPPALIFSPYGADKHPDHRAVASAVDRLCQKRVIACPVYEYPVWFWLRHGLHHLTQPQLWPRLRRIEASPFIAIKRTAMRAHQSQNPKAFGGQSENMFQPLSYLTQFFARYEIFFEKPGPV